MPIRHPCDISWLLNASFANRRINVYTCVFCSCITLCLMYNIIGGLVDVYFRACGSANYAHVKLEM